MNLLRWWQTTKYRRLLIIIGGLTVFVFFLAVISPKAKAPQPGPPAATPPPAGVRLPQPAIPNNASVGNMSVPVQLDRSLPLSTAATSLEVYEASSAATPDTGTRWAARFGFNSEPQKEEANTFLWLSDGYHMFRYNQKNNSFEYYAQPKTSPANPTLTDLAGFQAQVSATLLEYQLYQDPKDFEILRYTYLKRRGSEYSYPQSLEQADEVLFYIRPLLNGLPVVAAEQEITPTLIDLDKNGVVRQLVHHPWSANLKEKGAFTLKSLAAASQEVIAGKGSVVSVSGIGYEVPNLKIISVSRVYTAYLYPKAGETIIQPVYVFDGLASDASLKQASVTILLWAVAGK